MVTGSHIPFDRNGMKFYRPEGEITKADEAGIDAALAAPAGTAVGPARTDDTLADTYVSRYVDFFGPGVLAGRRVGLYEHSAAGRDLMAEALARLGAEVVRLGRTDDFIPIDTEAVSPEDAARIRAWVTEHRLAALVSTDGDGDRPLLADETGAVLRGDALGALVAHLLGADAVATPLNASTALERSGWFPRIRRTRIGSPYVIEAIEALTAEGARLPVGYEANGGFLLGGPARRDGRTLAPLATRDALLPIATLLAAAAAEGLPISALAARLPTRVTASDRLQEVDTAAAARLLATLATAPPARADLLAGLGEVTAVDTLDGVRMTLATGEIVHVRLSGNAPELRCYAEAAGTARAAALMSQVLDRLAIQMR
jgi:phosphomannomutase